jgi:hypothetical protein
MSWPVVCAGICMSVTPMVSLSVLETLPHP